MENEFIIKLNELLQQEDLLSISKEVGQLKSSFDDWLLHSEGKQQVETIKAKEKGETIEQIDYAIIKARFSELFKKYKDAKKQQLEIKNKLELENLKLKKNLISELKDLVENEENIGTAFNGYNSIQDTWKKIGDIPRDKREEVVLPFTRLENSRNIKTGGTGLGLSIAKNSALNHGGELILEDSPLGGLRVRLLLPL